MMHGIPRNTVRTISWICGYPSRKGGERPFKENAITDVNGDGTINSEDLNVIWMPANYLKDRKNCTTDF